MADAISPKDMERWIEEALAERPDIGLGKAVVDFVFEGRNPFEPRARRKPRTAFVLGAILFAAAVVCFWYFNLAG